jgi:hypothetical protein
MSKRSRNKKNKRAKRATHGTRTGNGDGSPIETRCQARGIVQVDRRKQASKTACRGRVVL